jgi:hypothetical protein
MSIIAIDLTYRPRQRAADNASVRGTPLADAAAFAGGPKRGTTRFTCSGAMGGQGGIGRAFFGGAR